jgi:hypothetical protein
MVERKTPKLDGGMEIRGEPRPAGRKFVSNYSGQRSAVIQGTMRSGLQVTRIPTGVAGRYYRFP